MLKSFHYSDLVSRNYLNLSQDLQAKVKKTRLAFVGCGLSSQIAEHAARLGYTHFELFDDDTVEVSNLNRQAYNLENVKKEKAHCLKEIILSINPEAQVSSHAARITTQTDMMKCIEKADIIINTMDCSQEYFDFVEAARQAHKLVLCPFNAGFSAVVICFSDISSSIYETLKTDKPLVDLDFYARLLQLHPEVPIKGFTATSPEALFAAIKQRGIDPQICIGVNLASCLVHACMMKYLNGEDINLAKEINYVSVG